MSISAHKRNQLYMTHTQNQLALNIFNDTSFADSVVL